MNKSKILAGITLAVFAGIALSSCKSRKATGVNPFDSANNTEEPRSGGMPPSRSDGRPEQMPAVAVEKDTAEQLVSASLMAAARNVDPEVTHGMLESGKFIYHGACVKCHAFKDAKNFTPERWERILTAMAPKARLTPEQTKNLRVYTLAYQKL